MKLIILTQYYPPEVGAPQNRLSDLAKQFALAGHNVTVLTAMPNYPSGHIHSGYGGLFRRELRDGVNVIRTFIYPCQRSALVPRLLSYFSFVLSSIFLGTLVLKQSDFLLVESPPLFLGIAAVWLNWITKAKLIFNVSDLWPESAVSLGVISRDSWSHRFATRLEAWLYRHASLVTGQSKSILEDISGRFPSQETFLLSNGTDTQLFRPRKPNSRVRAELNPSGRDDFIVLYAGLHGLAQGLAQVVETAAALQAEGGYHFAFIGDGPEKQHLEATVRDEQILNVSFLDPIPFCEVPEFIGAADALLVPLAKHIPGAVPSKLYEAMASGRPLVLIADGEAAEIVARHRAGLVVAPGSPELLRNALEQLRADRSLAEELANNARSAAVQHFDRKKIAAGFIELLCGQVEESISREQEPATLVGES